MKMIRILLFLLLIPAFAFAQYKVILKNGKVIEGTYLHEDQTTIYIESNGIQMNFKKDKLDLERMKVTNVKPPTPVEPTVAPKTVSPSPAPPAQKKPARVYTSEDLEQMKQIWESTQTAPTAPSTEPAPAPEAESQPTAETQSQPTAEAQSQPMSEPQSQPIAEAQSQPVVPPQPEPPPPPAPRDEKAIRDEIAAVKVQIQETEARIKDLRAKGRVTATWEKLLVKQQEKLKELEQELKEYIAARRAEKAASRKAAQTQPQPQPQQ